jgi:uncharacterized protein (DUF4213/DUF364 family)
VDDIWDIIERVDFIDIKIIDFSSLLFNLKLGSSFGLFKKYSKKYIIGV